MTTYNIIDKFGNKVDNFTLIAKGGYWRVINEFGEDITPDIYFVTE